VTRNPVRQLKLSYQVVTTITSIKGIQNKFQSSERSRERRKFTIFISL